MPVLRKKSVEVARKLRDRAALGRADVLIPAPTPHVGRATPQRAIPSARGERFAGKESADDRSARALSSNCPSAPTNCLGCLPRVTTSRTCPFSDCARLDLWRFHYASAAAAASPNRIRAAALFSMIAPQEVEWKSAAELCKRMVARGGAVQQLLHAGGPALRRLTFSTYSPVATTPMASTPGMWRPGQDL